MPQPMKITPDTVKADIEHAVKFLSVLKQMEIVELDLDQLVGDLEAISKSPTLLNVFMQALRAKFQV